MVLADGQRCECILSLVTEQLYKIDDLILKDGNPWLAMTAIDLKRLQIPKNGNSLPADE